MSEPALAEEDFTGEALAALGSDDCDFMVTAFMRDYNGFEDPAFKVECRLPGCEWGFSVGQMEVWEIVSGCREHWQDAHARSSPSGDTEGS